jgi:hypothetical protein
MRVTEKPWRIPPTATSSEREVLSLLHQCLDRAPACCRQIATVADHKTEFSKLMVDLQAIEHCMREMAKHRDDLRWLTPVAVLAEAQKRAQRWLVPFTVTGKKLFGILGDKLEQLHLVVRRLELIRPPKLGFIDLPDQPFHRTQGRPMQVLAPQKKLILPPGIPG